VEDPVLKDAEVSDHNETDNNEDYESSKAVEDAISKKPFQGKYWSSAIGIGGGAGGAFGGRFGGRRNLRAFGGGRHTESAVLMGLIWLKNHQNPDGSWSSSSFHNNCKKGGCMGAGVGSDLETTSMTLLAFLGAGHTHKHGKFKNTVKKALKFLKASQNPDGSFGSGGTAVDSRAHAVCTMAVAEAYGLSNKSPLIQGLAQKAVDFLVDVQAPYSGWGGFKGLDCDSITTGWAVFMVRVGHGRKRISRGFQVPGGRRLER
ncbi:MAG: prenyltransferase/squalene oxidase repeat-containing protein, partial [Planctomycetota bacterium]